MTVKLTSPTASLRRGNAVPNGAVFPRVCRWLRLVVFSCLIAAAARAEVPVGGVISNTAQVTYAAGSRTAIAGASNRLDLTVVPAATASTLEFLRYRPGVRSALSVQVTGTEYSASGEPIGPFRPLPAPVPLTGGPLDISSPVPLATAAVFFQGDPVFLRVVDPDRNRDALVRDTILLTVTNDALGERELLRLHETAPASGEFLGFIQSDGVSAPQAKDGVLAVRQGHTVAAAYADDYDAVDQAAADVLFDPVARVFDSRTGAPLSGVTVRLVDDLTGLPAGVAGADGSSAFPAVVTTGRPVIDAAGATYDFGPGGFRFPHVPDGRYRLELDPPPGYRAPTTLSDAALQGLSGAPYALVTPGSRGEPFFTTGVPLLVDIPVDPVDTELFVTKTAGKATVAVGDYLPYEIRVENTTDNDATDLTIVDSLPFGFRYEPGSSLGDGQPLADPVVAADGRTLVYRRADLPRGTAFTLRYVLAVVPGAPVGDAVNRVTAGWGQVMSNEAMAVVTVRRDLFGDTATVVGRVQGYDCEAAADSAVVPLAGVRIHLESGAFAVTDEQGRYHLAGVAPGAHVVQLDLASLPGQYVPGDCSGDSLAGEHPWSHLVDLQGGTLWRSDFRLRRVPPVTGTVALELDTELLGDTLTTVAVLGTEASPVRQPRLIVVLPAGTAYVPGSARVDDGPQPDPQDDDGTLTFALGDLPADAATNLRFAARVLPPVHRAELEVAALLVCDTPGRRGVRSDVVRTRITLLPEVVREERPQIVLHPRFPSLGAELGPADEAQIDSLLGTLAGLEIVAMKVVGHSDSQRIRPGAHPLYPDNLALSLARAEAVAGHLRRTLSLSEAQFSCYGMGASEPIADNGTAEGRALNRRVTVQVWTVKTDHILPDQAVRDYERVSVPVTGFRPGESWPEVPVDQALPLMPAFDETWLAAAPPGERILWPPAGHLPQLPSLQLAVQHAARDSVVLFLNDMRAGNLNLAGRTVEASGAQAVSVWTGLDLVPGDNALAVDIIDTRGRLVQRLTRSVHYSGPPVQAELVPERSVLVADGRTRPVIALRLTDAQGFPARRDVVGRFSVAGPHEAWRAKGDAERESITELQDKAPTYTVGADGIALLSLAPTTASGEAHLEVGLLDHDEEIRVWLQPQARDWILAGIVEGTVGYNTVAGNLESLDAAGGEDDFYRDGRLAFFAKGRLKGTWLLTMAYDSRDPGEVRQAGLFGVVDPDAYYTVYGDAVVQQHDAPSSDHLYIRLEREQFYALYGDFNSGLTVTELSRYSRAMTGLNSSRRGRTLGFDLFASENRQGFRRDELPGDGTSGLYQLTAGRIVPHSERIILQTRDRYRSEVIVAERHLARDADYTLDELDGTLYFRDVVPSQDENFNPVWIVVAYETEDTAAAAVTAGGRGSWRPGAGPLEIGLTGVREGTDGGRGDVLAGLDTKMDLTRSLRLKAEYAGSDTRTDGRRDAWFGELANRTGPLIGRLYYREQAAGFGLGQQNRGEAGTRKYGTDLRWQPGAAWRVDATAFGQRDLVFGADRAFGELKLNHDSRRFTAGAGFRGADDRQADGSRQRSRQLTADASVKLLAGRGRVRAGREQAVAGQDDIADFPTRTSLGLEYEVVRNQKLFLAQEIVDGGGPASHRTRLGVESVPWGGGRLTTAAERRTRESERRVFGNIGLKQSLRLNNAWFVDAGLDHGQSTTAGADSAAAASPTADDDFTAGSLGFTCRAGLWLVDQRLEYRTSAGAEKWGLSGGVHVEPGRGLGLLASLRLLRTDYRAAGHHHLSDVSVGLSWRPVASPWTVLQRLSWRTEDKTGAPFDLSNWRVVNNLNVLRMLGARDQLSALVGVRYNRDTIDGRRYAGVTDQLALEWRHFIGSRWDVGVRGASRHAWEGGVVDWSGGVSGGYRLLEDIWLSLGYNFTGYRDRDFSAADYTAQGPYLRFRVRLNQETTHEMLR